MIHDTELEKIIEESDKTIGFKGTNYLIEQLICYLPKQYENKGIETLKYINQEMKGYIKITKQCKKLYSTMKPQKSG